MERKTAPAKSGGRKPKKVQKKIKSKKLPKKFLVGHSSRCANSASDRCECRCGGLYHGTGIRG